MVRGRTLLDMTAQPITVRPPAVAGTFYPGQREQLGAQVDRLLSAASLTGSGGKTLPKALIVPHAGYVYSGPVAATAYAHLRARAAAAGQEIRRLVLIGPAHRVYVPGLAAAGAQRFATPLGAIEIDVDWQAQVRGIEVSPQAHAREHSLEVQLPFLQRILPAASAVPLLTSDAPPAVVGAALEALWGGPETRIIISSDLSHYLPYDTARAVDEQTARRILALDDTLDGEHACGCSGINGLLWVAKRRGLRPQLLDLRNSGDTAGSRDEVVGYAAFAFYEDGPCTN
jgi:AmmeMemoRadiSam system protein B